MSKTHDLLGVIDFGILVFVFEKKDNGVLLFNKLVVTGSLKWLWIKLVAKHVADTVPDEMYSLVNLARKV